MNVDVTSNAIDFGGIAVILIVFIVGIWFVTRNRK